jgi:hypothetical protein
MAISQLNVVQKWTELATSSPTSGTSVSFTSIPEYKDYRFEIFGLTNNNGEEYRFRFNNDTGSNYAYFISLGANSEGTTNIQFPKKSGIVTILDANGISKTVTGWNPTVGQIFALWNNQTAINRIDIFTASTGTFTAGTIKLYGRN